MQATVKKSYRFHSVRAFGGHTYIKGSWYPIPHGFEEQAKAHDLLDTREDKDEPVEIAEPTATEPQEIVEALKPQASRYTRRSGSSSSYKSLRQKAEEDQ